MKSKIQLEILPDSLAGLAPTRKSLSNLRIAAGESVSSNSAQEWATSRSNWQKTTTRISPASNGQQELFETANRNLTANEKHLKGKIEFYLSDIRQLNKNWQEKFDRVIMNPPWYAKGTGRLSPKPLRAAAKYELNGTLEDFLTARKISDARIRRLRFNYSLRTARMS